MTYLTDISIKSNFNVLKSLINSNGDVDFNILIPIPDGINAEWSRSHYDPSPSDAVVYFKTNKLTLRLEECNLDSWLIDMYKDDGIFDLYKRLEGIVSRMSNKDKTALYRWGERCIEDYSKFGSYDKYYWCEDNWGTDDNAFLTEVGDEYVKFCAGCNKFPKPIFEKLCNLHPNATINFHCFDERGYFVYGENINGHFIVTDEGINEDF